MVCPWHSLSTYKETTSHLAQNILCWFVSGCLRLFVHGASVVELICFVFFKSSLEEIMVAENLMQQKRFEHHDASPEERCFSVSASKVAETQRTLCNRSTDFHDILRVGGRACQMTNDWITNSITCAKQASYWLMATVVRRWSP